MPAITAAPRNCPRARAFVDYVAPLAFGTVLAATSRWSSRSRSRSRSALFITHIAPQRLALVARLPGRPAGRDPEHRLRPLGNLRPRPGRGAGDEVARREARLHPVLRGPASVTGRTMLVAGLVLAVMILPIVSAVAREVFSQTPRKLQEGALALGATRWEMIRMTVLPFGKSSVISGAMLGLGRALGETMAVDDHPLGLRHRHLQPDQPGEPLDDRRQHRPRLPRVVRARRQHPDRLRPRPLRDHPRHQPRSRGRSSPARRSSRWRAGPTPDLRSSPASCTAGTLPSWAPYGVIAGSAVFSAAGAGRDRRLQHRPADGLHRRSSPASRSTPGRAPSRVRGGRSTALVTFAIVAAFGLALIPLISLLFEVTKRGPAGLRLGIPHR